MDLVSAYAVVERTSDAIGKLAALRDHLKAKPDQAAAALAGALAEVHRTYLSLDAEITRLAVLAAPGALSDASGAADLKPLFELDGNAVRARVEQTRGHCTRIRNIYERDLKKWFETVFPKDNTKQLILGEVFDTLSEADTQYYVLMSAIGDAIGQRASAMLAEMMKPVPDAAAAHALARTAYAELRPMREALHALDVKLSQLENEFIDASGAA